MAGKNECPLSFYNCPPNNTLILAIIPLKEKKTVVRVYQWEPGREEGHELITPE